MSLRYFTPEGDPALFACPCGECDLKPSTRLLFMLDEARSYSGVAYSITSGPRCPEYNLIIGGNKNSEHMDGTGADILVHSGFTRMKIVQGLLGAGFNRIGIAKHMIHAGCSHVHPRPVIWTYD